MKRYLDYLKKLSELNYKVLKGGKRILLKKVLINGISENVAVKVYKNLLSTDLDHANLFKILKTTIYCLIS